MRRPSIRAPSRLLPARFCLVGSLLGPLLAPACLAGLAACLSGEAIDLGRDLPGTVPYDAESNVDGPDVDGPDGSVLADALADGSDMSDVSTGDERPLSGAPLCVPDPSFETAPTADAAAGPMLVAPPGWQVCTSSGSSPQSCVLPPTDGSSYLGLSIGFAPFLLDPASVDVPLCMTLQPGVTYSLTVDIASDAPESDAAPVGEPPALQVRASNTPCDPKADLLLRFSGVTNTCGWKTLCGTFVPQQSYSDLILVPEASSSTGLVFSQTNLLVDNLRSGGTCGAR